MIPLSQSLLIGQRARYILAKHLLLRVVLTYGATTKTYTTTRIKNLAHSEQVWGQTAQLNLEDTDKVLHGLDLEGYKAVISYGLITKAGEEWVARAPMWVVGQDRDSYRTHLECGFELEGTFNRWGKQKARSTYTVPNTNTDTVKTLLSALAANTLTDGTNTPYTNYPAYTITYDSEDDLIDTFIPADGFRVNLNDTRKSKLMELMGWTDCIAIVKNDEEIHIINPTISGATYDNEYSLVEGRDYHNFFNKRFRRRIVSPNKIYFESYPASGDGYSGNATDASASLTDMLEEETHYGRVTSNGQCANLANAYLLKKQLAADKGSAVIPFWHFGQEAYDYVKITDARAGDNRVGNLGFVNRYYKPGQASMSIGFGRPPLGVPALQGLVSETGLSLGSVMPLIEGLYDYVEQIIDILGDKASIDAVNEVLASLYEDAYFRNLTVTERFRGPYGTDKYG